MRRVFSAALLILGLSASVQPADDYEDYEIDPVEPNYSVITLPTNLRLPVHRVAFRLTHRFSRPLGAGSFGDLASDLFGFDGGAQVGIGLRFGLLHATQLEAYRTSDRTIHFGIQRQLADQRSRPFGFSLRASVEGLDNFSESRSPGVALLVSRQVRGRAALYLVPAWIGNTNLDGTGDDDFTVVLGLGTRVLLTDAASLTAEVHPRLAGYKGDRGSGDAASLITLGLEGRVGGHVFQLNFSNDQGTTPAQVARGQQGARDWFIGFNLSRRFF